MGNAPRERPRLAAIDIGTNSIRLVVAEMLGAQWYRVVHEERCMTRLGEGLYETGSLGPEPVRRSLESLGRMRATVDGLAVDELRVIATAAVREADNGQDLLAAAAERHGVRIEVIGEGEEARLALLSVRTRFPLENRPAAVVDIGGGSLEVILVEGSVIDQVHSLPLGAVRLTERFVHTDPLARDDWRALRGEIDRTIEKAIGKPPFTIATMIGSGGTFTTLAAMSMVERQETAAQVRGYGMTPTECEHLLARLRATPLAARSEIRGLSPERADIILAGAAAVARLARHLGCRQILINEGGIRDGLLLSMISERLRATRG